MAVVCVGDRLASVNEFTAGAGTYESSGWLYASLVGQSSTQPEPAVGQKPILSVLPVGSLSLVPQPGNTVTVKITRVQQMSAQCNILCVGPQALTAEFRGAIRQQDVRATEIDKVVMSDCFRPGDIVRASVLSLGDARAYMLTTAQDHLGVVYAKSLAGAAMQPLSWTEMQCPQTSLTEKRKVAKGTE